MHVRITENARKLLNNKELADKVIDEIIKKQKDLAAGKTIRIPDSEVSVTLATSIQDSKGFTTKVR